MTKKEVQQRVLKDGKHLSLDLFEWNEKTKTFSSDENGLILDFKGISGCTFKTGSYCVFATGSNCVFATGICCVFATGSDCFFTTGSDCIFKTGSNCVFATYSNCVFTTGSNCVVIRKDIYEIIEIPVDTKIKLNDYEVEGYTVIG